MKKGFTFILMLCLFALPIHALADKSPACEALGSEKAAAHLITHLYAYTDNWNGVVPSFCPDEGCKEYGHVHCYGMRVTLWDTPAKGDSRVPYYPFGTDGNIGQDTEFQLVDVVSYKKRYYANIRIYRDGYVINSGFVNADYIGCDCETFEGFEDIPAYTYVHPPFSLR